MERTRGEERPVNLMLFSMKLVATRSVAERLNLKNLCYVGSIAMDAIELHVESIAQLSHLDIIPAHYV
jgi:aspartate 1-decarboxylase